MGLGSFRYSDRTSTSGNYKIMLTTLLLAAGHHENGRIGTLFETELLDDAIDLGQLAFPGPIGG